MVREAPTIWLSPDEEAQLCKLVKSPSTPQALAFRARLVLRCVCRPGVPRNDHIARELGCTPYTVCKWRGRFFRQRLAGLRDRPRSGRPRALYP
jgi:hypothetical protein